MNRWLLVAVLVLGGYSGWQHWRYRALDRAPGVLAPGEPVQSRLAAPLVFEAKGYRIEALARYDIRARLLSREPYRMGREAELSPVDFALGWGMMSDSSLLQQMSVSQGNRFFYLRWQQALPVPESQVMRHAANTHLIPASPQVKEQLDAMRPGQVVELRGYLVKATAPDGWHWQSSLTRDDTGAGACELFWVESASVSL